MENKEPTCRLSIGFNAIVVVDSLVSRNVVERALAEVEMPSSCRRHVQGSCPR